VVLELTAKEMPAAQVKIPAQKEVVVVVALAKQDTAAPTDHFRLEAAMEYQLAYLE
jgi:hypothetical protein